MKTDPEILKIRKYPGIGKKYCNACKICKLKEDFRIQERVGNYRSSRCKTCESAIRRKNFLDRKNREGVDELKL